MYVGLQPSIPHHPCCVCVTKHRFLRNFSWQEQKLSEFLSKDDLEVVVVRIIFSHFITLELSKLSFESQALSKTTFIVNFNYWCEEDFESFLLMAGLHLKIAK